MPGYLLLQSLMDFPVLVLCNVHIPSPPLNEQQGKIMFQSDIQRARTRYCFVTLCDFQSGGLYCNLSWFCNIIIRRRRRRRRMLQSTWHTCLHELFTSIRKVLEVFIRKSQISGIIIINITNNTCWLRKTLIWPFEWRGSEAH